MQKMQKMFAKSNCDLLFIKIDEKTKEFREKNAQSSLLSLILSWKNKNRCK